MRPAPDTRSPDANPSGCGGDRTLAPKPIARGTGKPCGKACRQVTFGAYPGVFYEAQANLLTYIGGDTVHAKVYLVDLEQDKEWLVRERPPGLPGCAAVATDGRRLAYVCAVPRGSQQSTFPLQIYDVNTKLESDLNCEGVSRAPSYLGLGSSGVVASLATASKGAGAMLYRFGDKTLTNLSSTTGGGWDPHMSGTRVVWTGQNKQGLTQIMLHDTVSGTTEALAPSKGAQFSPRIDGSRIVWVDHRNAPGSMWNQSNSDIYIHDLSTAKTAPVTMHPARQGFPDVSGDWVVWQDFRNNKDPTPRQPGSKSNADIYARNVKTGEEIQVTSDTGLEVNPRVDRGRAFYRAVGGIFMVDLDALDRTP